LDTAAAEDLRAAAGKLDDPKFADIRSTSLALGSAVDVPVARSALKGAGEALLRSPDANGGRP
jgi:hypothetical protein